jgi:hypothetical protein
MSNKLAIEILNDFPLATEAIRDWFMKKMIDSFDKDNVPEDFKKGMLNRGVPDQTLAIMIDDSPRNFFDVLDSNDIVIEIFHMGQKIFRFSINGKDDEKRYEGRTVCERAAVIKAFELLN